MMVQKIAFIDGHPIGNGTWKMDDATKNNKSGIWLDGQLQKRFEEFAKTHKIIDWHTTQQNQSGSWFIVVRYEEEQTDPKDFIFKNNKHEKSPM
jgi:hypothetical protein